MKEVKDQIRLIDRERLLTEQERNHIISAMENRNVKLGVIVYCIFFFLTMIINIFPIMHGEILIAIIIFLVENIGVLVLLRDAWNTASKLAESAKRNEVYVREAIYKKTGYGNYATFEVNRNGRRAPFYAYALVKDNVKHGDKVILIQMDKKWIWIYKAFEDEILTRI